MASTTLSLRIPVEMRERLDRATVATRRSRNQIVRMALEQHLDRIAGGNRPSTAEAVRRIRSFAGAGAPASGARSAAEIDAEMRWLRGDD